MKNKIISGILLSAMIITIIPTISQAESNRYMTDDDYRGQRFGTSTRMMKKQNTFNIGGVVNTVSAYSFTINNIGRNNATTTYTVNVDSDTMYRNGTTTSSLSAITSDTHVMVSGQLSTTTKTIAAKVINIVDPNLRNKDINKYKFSSTTNPNGMYHKMINWFKNKFNKN